MDERYRILVVDDEVQWVQVAQSELEKSGRFKVTTASSIAEVQEHRNKHILFDAAIIDLGVGGGERWDPQSGEDLAQRLQEDGVTVGLLSALTAARSREIAERLGVLLFDKGHIDGFVSVVDQILFQAPRE